MENTKLSYSQISRYTMCGESYRLYYIEKIRPIVQSGALTFGAALDQAINSVLLRKGDAIGEFKKHFTNSKVGDVNEVFIPTCVNIVYANTDFDADLLQPDDFRLLTDKYQIEADQAFEVFNKIKKRKTEIGFSNLNLEEKTIYNHMNWLSLYRKGLLMIRDYSIKVLPKLKAVHAVQIPISIRNEVGDEVTGFVDFVADVEGYGPVILDNKTSTIEYEADSVITSPQLSLYMHALEDRFHTRKAGFVVLRKQVIKNRVKKCSKCDYNGSGSRHKTCSNMIDGVRCNGDWIETIDPEINIQFIIDDIPKRTEEIVLENADTANDGIKKKVFTRNMHMCDNWYGNPCPYRDLCFKNKLEGLVKK